MTTISAQALRLLRRQAPEFLKAVRQAKREGGHQAHLHLPLDAFEDDPFLLYACVWHAVTCGVAVTIPAR